jgi:hypothetical protein
VPSGPLAHTVNASATVALATVPKCQSDFDCIIISAAVLPVPYMLAARVTGADRTVLCCLHCD